MRALVAAIVGASTLLMGSVAHSSHDAGLVTVDSVSVGEAALKNRASAFEERTRQLLAREDGLGPAPKAFPWTLVLASDYFYNYHAFGSTYYVMAEVRNTGSQTVSFVKIYMDFKNSYGQVLASDWTYVTGSNLTLVASDLETDTCLRPGETGFFGAFVEVDMPSVATVAYSFEAETYETRTPDAFLVVSSGPTPHDSYGNLELTGTLRNTGIVDAIFSKVHVEIKGSGDWIYDIDFTYADGVACGPASNSCIHPGSSAPFEMYTLLDFGVYTYISKTAWDDYGTSSCSYSISPTSANFATSGGAGSLSVTASPSTCSWTARSNNSWIHVTSGSSGVGSGTVSYRVDSNSGSQSRTGTITAAGRTFTVHQDGSSPGCTYSIFPTSAHFGPDVGTASVSVTTQAGCAWNASESVSWVTILSGASGSGSGTVTYQLSRNEQPASRSTFMTIATHQFPVTQDGASAATYTYHVPGIARAQGAGGTSWRSSLIVCNISDQAAQLSIVFHHSTGEISRGHTLEAGHIMLWQDVVIELFDLPGPLTGAVTITSTAPVEAFARTYNQSPEGTYGQYLPSVEIDEALGGSDTGILPFVTKTVDFRTNVGILNLTNVSTTVEIRLFARSGSPNGHVVQILVPEGGWVQENDVFQAAGASSGDAGYATIRILSGGTAVWAYASIVDNDSGDPFTVPLSVDD